MRATELTIGKVRGLQQLADARGLFAMLRLDQIGFLRVLLSPAAPAEAPYDALVELTLLLTRILAPLASAALLDPAYGAAQAIGRGVLPGDVGLAVSLESSDDRADAAVPPTGPAHRFGVSKAKLMGASACTLSLRYRPDSPAAAKQERLVSDIGEAGLIHDLPFLLAPLSYSAGPHAGPTNPQARPDERPYIVLESAGRLAPLEVDLLLAEFPVDLTNDGPVQALMASRRLTEAVATPWLVHSPGASFDLFRRQVEIGCRGGASGFVAGRALWQEIAHLPGEQWEEFVAMTAAQRLRTLVEIVRVEGRPYHPLAPVGADWPDTYGVRRGPAPAALVD